MKRIIVIFIFSPLAALLLLFASPARADAIDDFVEAEIERQNIPGVAVGIFHNGEPLRMQGYGLANIEHRVPVRRETVFQSGSIGKMFTAAAVMALVEDCSLGLGESVRRYLPGAPAAWQAIHLRHLLNHTGGLGDPDLDLRHDYTDDALLERLYRTPARFEPGQRWEYSNAGYVLLGIVVGKVAGMHYGEVLRERIFGPAGMPTARVISDTDIVSNRAAGYELQGDSKTLKNQSWNSAAVNATADGSLYLTLDDYAHWDAVVATRALFQPETWRQILRPAPLNNGTTYPYGFGWDLDGARDESPAIGHSGAWQGFRTDLRRYDRDGVTFVVLANSNAADVEHILQGVAERHDPRYRRNDEGSPIADEHPASTQALRRSLDRLAAGRATAADFAGIPAERASHWLASTRATLASAGACGDPRLTKHRPNGDHTERDYLMDCANHALDVSAVFDSKGQVVRVFVLRRSG